MLILDDPDATTFNERSLCMATLSPEPICRVNLVYTNGTEESCCFKLQAEAEEFLEMATMASQVQSASLIKGKA